jgi:hypothetical protein
LLYTPRLPLLIATAGTGIAAVLFQVSAAPLMMQHSDDRTRDTLFSASAAVNLGLAGAGSLLGGYLPWLLSSSIGLAADSPTAYRLSFAAAGAGLLLAIIPLLLIAPAADEAPLTAPATTAPPATPPHTPQALVSRLFAPGVQHGANRWRGLGTQLWPLVQLLVPPGLISLGAALLIPYLNLFFKERWGSDDATLGIIFAALGIGTGLGALAAPALSARLGTIRAVAWAQLASIPFLLLLGFAPLLWLAVGAALMRGALFNLGAPLYDAFAMQRTEARLRPVVIGLINAAYAGGYIVAPPISVYVQERYGWTPLFLATALCYGAAIMAVYWLFIRPGASNKKLAASLNDPAR